MQRLLARYRQPRVGCTMTMRLRDRLIAEYRCGLSVDARSAQRLLAAELLRSILSAGHLSTVPSAVISRALDVANERPLSPLESLGISDDLLGFLIEKNGHAWVLLDREDRLIRAAFAAFEDLEAAIEEHGIDSVVTNLEDLIEGRVGDIAPSPPHISE